MIPAVPFDFLRVVPTAAVVEALGGFEAQEAAVVLAFAPPAAGAEIIAALPRATTDALTKMQSPEAETVKRLERRLELALRPQL